MTATSDSDSVLAVRSASLTLANHTLWSGLDLDVQGGEFLAVLGANGSGKTTLLRAVLGLQPLTRGSITVCGRPAERGSDLIGYVPQERRLAPPAPLRAADLVEMGLDGHRLGPGWFGGRQRRQRVAEILAAVGASELANVAVANLSGGEQQRVRIAQALATEPRLLLCDEPLLSLDPRHQREVVRLIDDRRRTERTAVLFVTHEINPVLPYVDRVLYLADGRFRIGSVDEVMTSQSLSTLYGARIEVLRIDGRIVVVGVPDHADELDSADDSYATAESAS
jgi:zinc/manganese transport system ATP-binding protein